MGVGSGMAGTTILLWLFNNLLYMLYTSPDNDNATMCNEFCDMQKKRKMY